MKLHFLRYFAVLAEELHFGRAAQRLSITQPPLSNAIKALEAELGVRLLERDSKHVELTPAGAAFLDEVRPILEKVSGASQVARAVASGIRGRLEIGITGSVLYRGVPEIVRRFGLAMPGVELTLREMASAEQVQQLLSGQLPAGFINASTVPPQLASLPLPSDDFVLCLPSTHRHARQAAVTLAELADEQFVMFARDVAPANHDNVIAIFSRAGIYPRTVHAARQWLTIIAMVAHGLGVSLVPRSLARTRIEGVRFVPIAGAQLSSPALLVWNPGHTSLALDSFIDCARQGEVSMATTTKSAAAPIAPRVRRARAPRSTGT